MNHWTGIGRWAQEIEVRYTSGGKAVATCDLAINEGYGDKKSVLYMPIVMWEKTAESVHQHSGKGRLVAVEGRISSRTYDGNDGKKHKVYEIQASRVQFLDSKKSGEAAEDDDSVPF